MSDEVWARVRSIPEGYSEAICQGRRYGVTAQTFARGRSRKVLARELGGSDQVSFNCYRTSRGVRLKPCEMPLRRVLEFLDELPVPSERTDGT